MANKRISELAVRTPQTTDLMLIGDPTTGYSYKTTLLSALNLGVPTTRTITINGTTFDLSANRTWSVGTVTSVGLTMPSAFNVASSPVTGSGTIAVTAAGLASQYIRGDGTLADFPGGGGGGGASVSYYLNGSVNQGTIGGVTYYEMNKTPILGAGTNFTTSSNGYIASFLTDAGDPALLKIPGGNWNTEFYFAASSGGGTPTYYIELYKYDGTTFTLIASSSTNPDVITGGTSVEQYFTTIAVPETVLTATDRLAIRIYVTTAGRTITLHTENSNLCQIITTFTTGLTALNGLTAQVQYFATGSAGTDFNISSSTATHTFNLPTASATNRGALSSADWTTFNNKVTSIIAGNAITVSNASGNVTVNHADTSGADPGATISGSNVFRSIVLDTYGHVTGLSYSSFLISDLGGTAISSPSNGQVLSYNGTNWVNSSISGLSIITGSGTTNYLPKFTGASSIGDSIVSESGSIISVIANSAGLRVTESGGADVRMVAGGSSGFFGTYSNHSLQFLTNSGTKLTLDASGNLGLGVTPSAWDGTLVKAIQLADNGASLSSFSTGNTSSKFAILSNNAYYDSGGWKYLQSATSAQYRIANQEHQWLSAGSGTAGNAISFTQAMTLDASGRLGVGTASPVQIAHLQATGTSYLHIGNSTTGSTLSDGFDIGYFSGETLLNIVQRENNAIAISTNNTERMRLDASGNVLVNTTTDNLSGAKLQVSGAATFSSSVSATGLFGYILKGRASDNYGAFGFYSNDGATRYGYIQSHSSNGGQLNITGDGGGQLTLDSRGNIFNIGNLGLGVTPSAWDGVLKAMQIHTSVFTGQIGNNTTRIGTNWYYNSGFKYIGTGTAERYDMADGAHYWFTAPSGTAGNAITFTQAMTLTASGNLGLGVTPSAWGSGYTALQIENTGFMADADRIWMYANGYFNGTSNLYIQNGFASRYYQASGQHIWDTAPSGTAGNAITFTQAMTLTSAGRLLLGTTTDNTVDLLQVAGSVSTTGVIKVNEANGLAIGSVAGVRRIQWNTSTNELEVYNSSNAYAPIGASAFNVRSDYRLKTDLKDFVGIDIVNLLKVYDYEWKSDKSRSYGVLAHELQSVIPYAVTGMKDGEMMQGVDYSKIVPVLVKAIQELKTELDTLKK